MINTIFYFADTLAEYSDMFSKGLVKPHTICFAKDTKTIWRNGMRFSGLRQDEVDDEIHNLTDDAINNLKEGVRNLESGLNTAVRAAAEEKIRLNGEISRINGDVATVASNLTATAAAIRDEVRNGELYTSEGWDPKINAYLKTVGLWDYGTGDTEHVTKWSTLRQSVSDVSSEVNRVEAKADGYNNTLQSKINQEVTDRGKAVTTLSNTFARSTEDLQSVIEWMYSGLYSSASADMSYAEIIAAGKNGASSAISDLRTSIETTSDGKYVAQGSLTSAVDNAISGIVNDVTDEYANTSIFSQIDTNSGNIAAINTFIGPDVAQSTLAAKLNGAEAGAVATVKDDLASMHILSKSGNNYTADVYTKSQTNDAINSATASMATTDDLQRSMGLVYTKTEADNKTNQLISEAGLVSENEFTAASIITKVNGASSSVKINADHINIDANHQLDLSAQTITIDADDINLVGQTHFESAIGDMIEAQSITISDVDGEIQTILENGSAKFTGDVIIVNDNKIQAGLKGGENIRFWSGGNITDTGSEPTDALLSSATFKVDKNGKLYCSDVDITGKMIGTDGNIGGFNIGDKILSNTAYDASIVIQNAASNPTLIARIGKNAIDEITNKSCSILAESKTSGTFNTALYLNAEGGTYNYAFHGNGNGVLNGVVFGYKTQFKSIPSGSSDALSYIYLRDGATTIITGSHSSGHVVLAVPSIDDVRQCLGLSTNSTTPFAIELTFINLSGYEYVHLGFRGEGSLGEKYPWLMNDNNRYMASRLQIALGDVIKLMLIYAPSSSGIGSYEYRAQLIVRRE